MDFVNVGDEQVFKYCDGNNWVSWGGEEVTGMPAPLSSSASLGGETMIDGFPDALVCSEGANQRILYLEVAPNGTSLYVYKTRDDSGQVYKMFFTSSGSYDSHALMVGSDCLGKSTSQLYTDGQAFNFVGGSSGGVGTSVAWSDITGIPAGFADGTDDGAGGGGNLPDLGDVSISSPANGDSLVFNGSAWVNQAGSSASASGADTEIQFNDGGSALGGDAKFTWNKASGLLTVDGNITYTGGLTDTSDARLKENVAALSSDVFTKVKALEPVSFTMKATPDAPPEFGFMAQDVRELFPNLVVEADDEMKTLSLNYQGMIALLVKSVQEMERENAQQRESFAAELQSLRAEIETLKQATSTGE